MKPKLPDGLYYGTDKDGKRVCRGAMMGRANILPDDPQKPIKLYLSKLKRVDGDYDSGGCYWGTGSDIYWACSKKGEVMVFTDAESREEAKKKVMSLIPGAKFYR